MPPKKRKVLASVKSSAKVARPRRAPRPVSKAVRRERPVRKVFNDQILFGALPGMSEWALPLLKELRDERLPLDSRIHFLESALRSLRAAERKQLMAKAATALSADYRSDKELTAFTAIDLDTFYEAR